MSNLHKFKFLKFNKTYNIDGSIYLSLFVKKQKMPEIFSIYINYMTTHEILMKCYMIVNIF